MSITLSPTSMNMVSKPSLIEAKYLKKARFNTTSPSDKVSIIFVSYI
ncbi:hypothetical protein NHP164001_03570 [Helicobacter trogontum]|uniref:Uncharacterized protein n=1 Tax=Helicobacter trogontum TaxID=50960 RepID=A0ABQ0D2D0_9HELI